MLQTPTIALRPWRRTDIDALLVYANDRRIWENLRDGFPHPYTRTAAEGWIDFTTSVPEPHRYFAIALNDEAIGAVGLDANQDVHRFTGELGYWLGAKFWGRGYATDAVKAITTYGFDTLALARIEANVFDWNVGSQRLLEKTGFALEGRRRRHVFKDGRLGDALLYARVRDAR